MENQNVTQQEPVASAISGAGMLDGGLKTGAGATAVVPDDAPKPEDQLKPKQMRLVAALVSHADIHSACKAANVGRTAAHRWLKQPAFQEELTRQRDAVLGEALANVRTHTARAVTELAALLNEPDGHLRRLACHDILTHALKIRNTEDIERRLKMLEKSLKKPNGKKA
jgi:hypothetical protein